MTQTSEKTKATSQLNASLLQSEDIFIPDNPHLQVTDLQAQVAFLQAGEQASYGNWGSTLDGDTSYYTTTSGTSSNHMNEALVFGGDKDSYNQIDHQPSYSDEDSYKINQPNYDSYQPVYDSYTSPLSQSYSCETSVKYLL